MSDFAKDINVPNNDCISRQAAIDALNGLGRYLLPNGLLANDVFNVIKQLPSAQPEPLTLRVNHELTKEEYDKLMHDIKDAPIVLLPPAQPSADVVEVVRCKDCKFAHLTYSGDCKYCDNVRDDDDFHITVYYSGDHYCSYGERRRNG